MRLGRPSSVHHSARYSNEKATALGEAYDLSNAEDPIDLDWYPAWLSVQRANLPAIATRLSVQGASITDEATLNKVSDLVEAYARENRGFSIDDLIEHFCTSGVFQDGSEQTPGPRRLLIFAILAWQSMIYQPAFNICSPEQLAIHHDADGPDSGLVFDAYTVPADMCDRPLHVLLKCFGNLLPARSSDTTLAAV